MHQALLSEVNKINVGKNKNIEMVATSNIVGKLRQYKTIDEIQILKKVCSITYQAMDVVNPTI